MLLTLLTAAREKAGRSIQEARTLGNELREVQAKNATDPKLGEMTEKFDNAAAAAANDIKEVNRLETQMQLEAEQERMTTPVIPFTGRRTAADSDTRDYMRVRTRAERMERRRVKHQQQMFARAGVTDAQSFERFKEAHAEAFVQFVMEGNGGAMRVIEEHKFKPMESMALLSIQGDLGGFLVPEDFRNDVIRDLAGFAVMRGVCRVERTGSSTLTFPTIQSATSQANIYATGYQGAWQPEGYVTGGTAPTVQNQPKFGQARIPVHTWAPNAVEVTQELLNDSGADLEGILVEIIAETLGLDEDAAFFNGNGNGRPLGIFDAGSSITGVNTGSSGNVTYDGLVDLYTGLPSQYRANARFMMNSLTLGKILKLKDSQNRPLFPINELPGTLLGKPITFSEFIPDVAAAAKCVIFGDFRFYGIADRQELRVQRLIERYAPNVGLLPTAREGGQVLRSSAFRIQVAS